MSLPAFRSRSMLDSVQPGTRGRALWTLLAFSLAVTALGAAVAGLAHVAAGADFLLTFVIVRWLVVLTLVLTPLLHRLVLARHGVRLPWAMQTPFTALLLTVESICFDILSAQV